MRIHLAYSERHYHPGRPAKEKYRWYSCAQLAEHLFRAARTLCPEPTYGDSVPPGEVDLLVTNRLLAPASRVKRVLYFASSCHPAFLRDTLRPLARFAEQGRLQESFPFSVRLRARRTFANADGILGIGNASVAATFTDRIPRLRDRTTFLDCGIASERFRFDPRADRPPAFVYAATNFTVRKGAHLLAEAWPRLACEHPGIRLTVLGQAGDVPLDRALRGVPGVVFVGPFASGSEDYIRRLNGARWALQPSLAEGQTGTLLEAMSCGCAPVATPLSGVNAGDYGGVPIQEARPGPLGDAVRKALSTWNPELPSAVRNRVETRHRWTDFEQRAAGAMRAALDRPAEPSWRKQWRSMAALTGWRVFA